VTVAPSALAGGWGADAADAVARAAARTGAPVQRIGPLAVTVWDAVAEAGAWRCWVAGWTGPAPAGSPAAGAAAGLAATGPGASGAGSAAALGAHGPGAATGWPAAHAAATLAAHGPAALGTLRGGFVLVALDRERMRAWVVRDPLGARPLVHARLRGGVVFAEHERDVLALLPATPPPDERALEDWIAHRTLPLGRTLHAGVVRLAPGSALHLADDGRGPSVERIWRPRYAGTLPGSRTDAEEALREAAFAAVRRAAAPPGGDPPGATSLPFDRSPAAAPPASARVGLRLSGGLDSACVAAALADAAAGPGAAAGPLAIAARFPQHPQIDERGEIEATAAHTGLALRTLAVEPPVALLRHAVEHLARWRVPPGSPNLFLWDRLAAAAREEGVAILLDGEGGDELFGLNPHLLADRLRRGRPLSAWRLSARMPGMGDHPGRRARLRVLRDYGLGGLRGVPDRARTARRAGASRDPAGDPANPPLDGPLWWCAHAKALIDDPEALDVHGHLRREALDGGVERGHPFLHDVELVETALAIAPELQYDAHRDRPLLRDALRGRIPEQVRARRVKPSFGALTVQALQGSDGRALAAGLTQDTAPIRAHTDPRALDALLARVPAGLTWTDAATLWRLATTDLWLRAQADPKSLETLAASHERAAV
jgi:asparagine synthase (glutamine-hydrolysing)